MIKNYLITKSDQFGRYVIADRDLKQGELILCEEPKVVGLYWESDLCCLSCYEHSTTFCKKCLKAPLCSKCTAHDEFECNFLTNSQIGENYLMDHFDIITPLRVLFLSKYNKEGFDEILKMEHHCKERKETDIWSFCDSKVIKPLLSTNILDDFSMEVSEEMLQQICGILDVNTFEIRGSMEGGTNTRGIYPEAAMFAHSCISNTLTSVDSKRNLRIHAAVDIKKGEPIFINYTNTLYNTADRKLYLREGKYFDCYCERCCDPTEFGTNLSSIKCTFCDDGLFTFQTNRYLLFFGRKNWKCDKCGKTKPIDEVDKLLAEIKEEMENIHYDVKLLEESIIKFSQILNPNHSFVLELKQAIAAILRERCVQSLNKPSVKTLKRKLELCEGILPTLKTLQPGISRLTGIALYETYSPIFQLAKRDFDLEQINVDEFIKRLFKAETFLKESISMLMYEHFSTPEGKLGKKAIMELKELRELIEEKQK